MSVPPLTGWPAAAALLLVPPPELLEPPQAASPSARASSATSATATHIFVRPLMSLAPFLPHPQVGMERRAAPRPPAAVVYFFQYCVGSIWYTGCR